MRTFSLFVHDSRYSVPSLYITEASDDMQARRVGGQLLRNSERHLSVDVYEDDRLITRVDQGGSTHSEITGH